MDTFEAYYVILADLYDTLAYQPLEAMLGNQQVTKAVYTVLAIVDSENGRKEELSVEQWNELGKALFVIVPSLPVETAEQLLRKYALPSVAVAWLGLKEGK